MTSPSRQAAQLSHLLIERTGRQSYDGPPGES